MNRSLVVGGTGRLGSAVASRLRARGDEVFAVGRAFDSLPEGINYAIFCQRYRGPENPAGEFLASVILTERVLSTLGFSDLGDRGVVIISSITGAEADAAHPVWYQCAKAAQIHLGKHLALKLRVRVNVVCPGAFTGAEPVLDIQEIVDMVEFLCNPGSVFGQTIVMKGRPRVAAAA